MWGVVAPLLLLVTLVWLWRLRQRSLFVRLLLQLFSRPWTAPASFAPASVTVAAPQLLSSHASRLERLQGTPAGTAAAVLGPALAGFPRLIEAMLASVPHRFAFFGAVHASNRLYFARDPPDDLELLVRPLSDRPTRSGRSFTYELTAGPRHGPPSCVSRPTFLFFGGGRAQEAPPPPPLTNASWENLIASGRRGPQLLFYEHEGRDMARITSDVNPIHLHRWLAWLFGFRGGVVAPGMLVQLKLLASVPLPEPPFTVSCVFRRPVFMPGVLNTWISHVGDDGSFCFEVRHPGGEILQAGWVARTSSSEERYLDSNPF